MVDRFGRNIDTIRISLTERCNLNCFYCNPDNFCVKESGLQRINGEISLDFILKVINIGLELGINRVKFTGGEPLLRKDIVEIINEVSKIKGIKDLSITTNGIFLKDFAKDLKKAGLHRINVSLDTLDRQKYIEITGFDGLDRVIDGIFEAKRVGFEKIKINTVLLKNKNENEIEKIREFCSRNLFQFQTINMMILSNDKKLFENCLTDKPPPCSECSRIRLTSRGKLLPCLFHNEEIEIKDDIRQSIIECILKKPEEGNKNDKIMKNIGG